MPAASKRARKVHNAAEYDVVRAATRLRAPRRGNGAYAWSIDSIRAARDAQLAGTFRQPALLAAAMRTDDALFVAYQNRLAPQRGLPVEVRAAGESARAVRIRDEADALFGPKGVGIAPGALETINGDLANHGIAFGINLATPREDGSRIDVELHHWPIENVRWDSYECCFYTQVESGGEVPITHGDGQWVIFSKHEHEPWRQEACVLPAALVWADHSYGRRDRSKHSVAVGGEKWIGTLPEQLSGSQEDGTAGSKEAGALLDTLESLATEENAVGLEPFGSKIRREANDSSAWQNFKEIIDGNAISAARIYNGQDATSGSQSSGPGVDASRLWGVRNDIVEGDLGALERGIFEGLITPWCALNFGDSSLAPWRKYLLPDPDESAYQESIAARTKGFFEAIASAKEQGFQVDQPYVDRAAKEYGIAAPRLPEESNKAPSITLAPTDIARVVSVNEARASAGLGPLLGLDGLPDPDGRLTVEEFSAKKAAAVTTPFLPAPAAGADPAAASPASPAPAALRALLRR